MIIGISIPSLIAIGGSILTYGYINDVKSRQGLVRIADDLKERVFEVRRNEKNFLHYQDSGHHESLRHAITALAGSVNEISQESAEEIGTGGVSLVDELLRKYSGLADELDKNFRIESDITGTVGAEGKKLETLVSKKRLAKELSTSFILRLRLIEKNYMLSRDEKSLRELNKVLLQIKNIMPFCYECIPYIDAVHALSATHKKIDSIADGLQSTGDRMEKITGEMAENEREKINSFISMSQKLLLAALALMCTLGPLFVYKTSGLIAAPIKRLAEITRRISAGDISLRAPLKEHDETYSLAVSFNSMLDTLQKTQQSLQESLGLLNEKQAQLVESEKRASMGFLVAGIAHELNNPLNNISLRAETMKEGINDLPPEQLCNYVDDIIAQSERGHNIVVNLLDFARARKSSTMEKLDIVSVVRDSLNLVASQLRVNNIKLDSMIPARAYYINGNRSKLEQIIISIINNAIQAMGDTGMLSVAIEPDTENRKVNIRISDTGKGIAESDIKNIFEPFFTTKAPGEGTGLGLAVSHTLVTEHNGEIVVESKVGAGTTFMIKLPLCEAAV